MKLHEAEVGRKFEFITEAKYRQLISKITPKNHFENYFQLNKSHEIQSMNGVRLSDRQNLIMLFSDSGED